MSKRLFILGSLLETHPGRASTEARVWTLVVVEAEIRTQRGGAPGRNAEGRAVGPFSQQRLDEALRFAVRLRAVGPREAVAHQPALCDRGEDAGSIRHRVVGDQPTDSDAASAKPGEGPLE